MQRTIRPHGSMRLHSAFLEESGKKKKLKKGADRPQCAMRKGLWERVPMLSSRYSGPLVLGFLGCSSLLVAAVAYARASGAPMRMIRDEDGVVRFQTREEALQDHLEASERLSAAAPTDESRARLTKYWREALREAQASEGTAAPPRAKTKEELNL